MGTPTLEPVNYILYQAAQIATGNSQYTNQMSDLFLTWLNAVSETIPSDGARVAAVNENIGEYGRAMAAIERRARRKKRSILVITTNRET